MLEGQSHSVMIKVGITRNISAGVYTCIGHMTMLGGIMIHRQAFNLGMHGMMGVARNSNMQLVKMIVFSVNKIVNVCFNLLLI